ncbi:bifunctional protein-serine/threonine kinase/phosphatase [Saccharophagus degradans]|uniref:bifunctional protein-serine/threonine kinase/phosphatase n=1 Tax=Saccharophagus degradans TaxID=86304 RepID=UPI0024781868|nr:bifunctional protein-serine/threonine kinase/phosphatase [Saccharophagus degradans]WGO99729.1 bifunctional protein-serine/threonine kinase/phosphatase [Saccharophagus degradans]
MTAQLKVSVGQCSDKGRKAVNQDFHAVHIPKNAMLTMKGVAMAMADGISSSEVSQIASQVAVKNFLDDYYCTSEAWSVKNSVERVLSATNSWLHSQSLRSVYRFDLNKGYVCTFSTIVIKNTTAHIFHVGDTRVYRLNKNGLEQLTNDHRLWETQEISYLSRALGIESDCAFDYQAQTVHKDDVYIIATDGVYEFAPAGEIISAVNSNAANLDAAAKKIVEYALSNGSDDNLSIQILRVDELPEQANKSVKQQAEALPLPPQLHPRMEFDGYIILRELHFTSRSRVYLAQDTQTKNNVVLKVLSTELSNTPASLERFLLEEWIARRINSSHVLKADSPDRKRNYIYTVFEYIEGQTLAQWALDNPKPKLEIVRDIIEQIAKGLQAFHRMEMLHQDLRPENIMLDKDGTVKIIDFGAVSVAGLNEAVLFNPDTYLQGTALYSAPEYFLGQPGSPRSELFSLGVITYFLLSGEYPYGTNVPKAKTISAQRNLWYNSLLSDDSEIPAWVDDAIRKAVHPLPDRRQEEIFEYIHDLRHPNKQFLDKSRPPLMERNPIAVWQGISLILAVIVVYLLVNK